jgi:hypothetical protein
MEVKKELETPGILLPYWILHTIHKEGNTMEQFLLRHKDSITGVLSCFDRVLFRGTLRSISYLDGMKAFLATHKILLKDFGAFVQGHSSRIKQYAETFARRYSRPYQYILSSSTSKEEIAKGIMEQDGITDGLICVLSCVEPCQSYAIRKDRVTKKLKLIPAIRKCLHFYFYFIDREFGFMHVRIQSWFPCPIQMCINGHEWLARKMDKAGMDYQRRENCFVQIEDIKKAQKMADATVNRNWHKLLDRFGQRLNPLLHASAGLDLYGYYWTIRQAEYATDIIFKDASCLKRLYPRFIHHAIEHFSAEDVMRFLGRRSNVYFSGEIISNIRTRIEGTRVRHWVEENSIKMYDKQGCVLRIETTINNPRRFKVYREACRQGRQGKAWIPMRKGVADIYRRIEVSRAANARYLEALSVIGDEKPSHRLLDSISRPVYKNNHRYRGLRPIAPDEAKLFQSVLHGEFLLRGFRNANIRHLLFPITNSDKEKRRNMGRTSRFIRLLRAHGLIHKVPKTRLYRITPKGHLVMSTSLIFRNTNISLLEKAA